MEKEYKTILTENNAFQNIGKALRKECTAIHQIEDFLQYCIQLIFFESTCIAGTVHPSVLQVSKDVVDILENTFSINNISFEAVDESKKVNDLIIDISQILNSRLDSFTKKFKDLSKNDTRQYLGSLPPDATKFINDTTEGILKKDKKIFDYYLPTSNFSSDSCFTKIINVNNGIIIDELFRISDSLGWDEAMTIALIAEIRLITNRRLAYINKQIYFPSVKRGRIDKLNIFISENVESIMPKWGSLIKLEMPFSIKEYLTDKGKGKAENILRLTCELREKFRPVREFINKMGQNNTLDQILALNEIIEAVKLYDGKKKSKKQLILENTYTHSLGVGPISMSAPITDWETVKREDKLNICVQSFNEIIYDMSEMDSHGYYKTLIENCMKN